ncbi:MAG: glucosidase [Gammaproteobacteria bacterium]|nr:glucosidase [Gammaproteobacteria bacterium]
MPRPLNNEQRRLHQQRRAEADWYRWGPYLSERAWGTVREDYSPGGDAWSYFPFEHAHMRAYRWSEDGLAGFCDSEQRLCFAVALWNGHDPLLKERAFGLTNAQGNRGEEVKEYYFYLDATPTHSWLRYRYKYPQSEFPYATIIDENAGRSRSEAAFGLLDTGVFDAGYWDIDVTYAKHDVDDIFIRIAATNRGRQAASLHLLPTMWFRNSWAWDADSPRPRIETEAEARESGWGVIARHDSLGSYRLSGRQPARLLFTDNETNSRALWDRPGPPFTKDGFHRLLIDGDEAAVNPDQRGTKMAALRELQISPGETQHFDLRLQASATEDNGFGSLERVLSTRRAEADAFYDELQPEATTEDHRILRQALSGMIWNKQFYHFDVNRWLEGDIVAPPQQRRRGRNSDWRHVRAADIFSMPDSWEYPWFAAWDLAYHCAPLGLVDTGFAKQQLELLLGHRYLHPTGQMPAYEWNFGDVNPPVHAAFVLRAFRADMAATGEADYGFLQRCFNKLLLNYSWWLNRKDPDGENLFGGGFLGLDNISVFDRSTAPLPDGYRLVQADATGWMAMYALNMTVIALELNTRYPDYEPVAIQSYEQFLAIAESIRGFDPAGVSLWDVEDGFFKDVVVAPDGDVHWLDIYSWVGLIPLFACEVLAPELLAQAPAFSEILRQHKGGEVHGHFITECPHTGNERGEHLLALVDQTMLYQVLQRVLDEEHFLSPFGVRSLSREHASELPVGVVPGIGELHIRYTPGEAESPMYGGNSNWRGPIWLPTNYSLVQALERYHRYLGDEFTIPLRDGPVTLREAIDQIADRVVGLYRRRDDGTIPALRPDSPFQDDPHWKELALFYEYFHAETGRGLGAAHQTGWTGLLANLVMRNYLK